jgi:peroxiredoxin
MDAYRDQYAQLFNGEKDVVLLAISADSPGELASWAKDAGYPFRFLSDTGGIAGQLYGAWMPDHRLDRRSLFVIGPDARVAYRQTPFREVDPSAYTELGAAIDRSAGR